MENKTHIQFRVSKQDKELFKSASEVIGLSLSEWIRLVSIIAARKDLILYGEKKRKAHQQHGKYRKYAPTLRCIEASHAF